MAFREEELRGLKATTNMKKLAALIVGIFAFVATSQAQIEVSPFVGYTFGDKFYAGRVGDGMSYGASIAYPIRRFASIEFTYMGQQGTAESYYSKMKADMNSNYFLLGLVKNIPVAQAISVYGGGAIGIASYNTVFENTDAMVKFGVGFKAGVKFWLNDKVAIFTQINANFPVTDVNADVWWTLGGGPDAGLSTSVPFTQFGFNAGLAIKLGSKGSSAAAN